jgi:hypothetical protein
MLRACPRGKDGSAARPRGCDSSPACLLKLTNAVKVEPCWSCWSERSRLQLTQKGEDPAFAALEPGLRSGLISTLAGCISWRMSGRFLGKPHWAFGGFVALDALCVGMGMGVPIFCILFGLPVGWQLAQIVTSPTSQIQGILARVVSGAALTSAVTFGFMALIWGRCIAMLFDPTADLANFGIPLILYGPKASFIGWLVLMILISPFLQFLMTRFGAHLRLLRLLKQQPATADAGHTGIGIASSPNSETHETKTL